MQVSIKVYADSLKPLNETLELIPGTTVQSALEALELFQGTEDQLLVVLVNQKNARPDDELHDGDRILILQSMAGG